MNLDSTEYLAETAYYIGWDVGGWHCDRNPNSRDALVILDAERALVGSPWRGNLRKIINRAGCATEWIAELFSLCQAQVPDSARVTLAIDTPLGFSEAFTRLTTQLVPVESVERSESNPYLFRQTELYLLRAGLTPLSAVKDMIGSQATKGLHVLAKFAPRRLGTGVWSAGAPLTAIEAYPAACRHSPSVRALREDYPPLGHDDKDDALTCALVAYLFARQADSLIQPGPEVPAGEGWIWVPRDALAAG